MTIPSRGANWPCWGHVGPMLAHCSLLGAFFSLLGASYALFEHFWRALAVFLASWSALGSIWEAPGPYFSMFFRTIAFVLPNKCINCCRTPKLALASAFRSLLKRGGTCAAHPPPPEGMPSVPDSRYKLPNIASKAFLNYQKPSFKGLS